MRCLQACIACVVLPLLLLPAFLAGTRCCSPALGCQLHMSLASPVSHATGSARRGRRQACTSCARLWRPPRSRQLRQQQRPPPQPQPAPEARKRMQRTWPTCLLRPLRCASGAVGQSTTWRLCARRRRRRMRSAAALRQRWPTCGSSCSSGMPRWHSCACRYVGTEACVGGRGCLPGAVWLAA